MWSLQTNMHVGDAQRRMRTCSSSAYAGVRAAYPNNMRVARKSCDGGTSALCSARSGSKEFLDASAEERAKRRCERELPPRGLQ